MSLPSQRRDREPEFSVVIPTHDRMDVLPETMEALEAQEDAPAFEIVVVVDGGPDEPAGWLRSRQPVVPTHVLVQEKLGPAVARNRGVARSSGKYVALLGDDTVPDPGWLAAHRDAHACREGPVAVVGHTAWHPDMHMTHFLRYLATSGKQFGYPLIEDPEAVPALFFYASNLSVPRSLLGERPFHESFKHAAWEDMELGYRLAQQGAPLVYEPTARAHHLHPTDVARCLLREERIGRAAVTLHELHPELGPLLRIGETGPARPFPRWLAAPLESLARLAEKTPIPAGPLWWFVLRNRYLEGAREEWNER